MKNGTHRPATSTSTTVMSNMMQLEPMGASCTWIPWQNEAIAKWLPDPTRLFSASVLMVVWGMFLYMNDWNVVLLLHGFFLNPYVILFFIAAMATVWVGSQPISAKQTIPLPMYDRWAAEWYFWNAFLYHMVMDGATGSFQLIPVVVQQYAILDRRFQNSDTVVWAIGVVELFLMGPLCLLTLYSILQRHPSRFPLELIVSSLQFMGMILFVISELYEEQVHVPALDPVGIPGKMWANVGKGSLYHAVYYWFGFWFCNGIWGVIPLLRIHRAYQECVRALQFQQQSFTTTTQVTKQL